MRWLMAISRQSVPLLLVLVAALPQTALALTPNQVYEQVKDSVVIVKTYDRQGKPVGHGSGVMLPSGDIITNFHVIKAGVRYTVGLGKQSAPATLKTGDPDKDLYLLSAPGLVAEPARLGKAAKLKVGDPVYAVGAPQGLELSLSEGIVSQLRGGDPPIIQTTVAISPGSSGGGLFNAQGELVGITTFYLKEGQSLNFAVPVEWIGEVSKGKKHGRFVIEDPKESWENRAEALKKADDWQGLLAHCRRWTQAEPGNMVAWHFLGATYSMLDRHREAVEATREALRLKPDYAEAWHNLSFEYILMDRYREAIDASREALRLKPDYADAWYNLARAYALSGNQSAALEAVRELRRYDPQKADKLFNIIMKP